MPKIPGFYHFKIIIINIRYIIWYKYIIIIVINNIIFWLYNSIIKKSRYRNNAFTDGKYFHLKACFYSGLAKFSFWANIIQTKDPYLNLCSTLGPPRFFYFFIIIMVFVKSTVLPWLSVNLPSSITCKSKFKTSPWAFSTSSKSITLYGLLLTASVKTPPSS